jgi:hypothetical protein
MQMKTFLIVFYGLILFVFANGQSTADQAIYKGDMALKKGDYKSAINNYFAAEAFDPKRNYEVVAKINNMVNDLKKKYDACQSLNTKISPDLQKTTPDLNSQLVLANARSQNLMNAIYFYENRFALANAKGISFFIDRNGDKVKKLGEWLQAEQFDYSGFAKVIREGTTRSQNKELLIDTTGKEVTVFTAINDNEMNIRVANLSGIRREALPENLFTKAGLEELIIVNARINELSSKIGDLKKLTTLDLSQNNLQGLPSRIGDLKNLRSLNVSFNPLKSLPRELGTLKNLRLLDLRGTQITKADIDNITVQLPNCRVISL